MIDWDVAVSLGSRLAGDGPQVSGVGARRAVSELRRGAKRSTDLVRDFTGLDAPPDTAPLLVVDRRGWVQANVDAFASVIGPVTDRLVDQKGAPPALARAIGSRITGAEIGGLLGFLAGKVLGQFDPFHDPHGRLMLVAPNIVATEQALGAKPSDFRLWVCLHEETHRVQFTANPWLRDHLSAQVRALTDSMETDTAALLADGAKRVVAAVRAGRDEREEAGPVGLMEIFASEEQRAVIDRVTGVMSLLEGHADVVMDGVGPEVIPTVDSIRASFEERRDGLGVLDKLLRRLLGLDQKMAQYRDGAVFVRHCVDRVGMDGFNAVWTGPETLPSKAEIHDPAAWVRRVHG
ncbi:zinc-dependent metalloprotease [Nocardioidaceae bacterium]|nr:zinc-dependent metalloprotease [Nocardioidaceae bacterium]